MSKPYLVVEQEGYSFKLCWFFPEDSDLGGSIGDTEYTETDLLKATGEDRECAIAYLAAVKTPGVVKGDCSLTWESKSAATSALRVVKAALATDGGAPMPDWANRALAAGWKMPKGWKP